MHKPELIFTIQDVISQLKREIRILESANTINRNTIKVLQDKNKKLETKLSGCINSWDNLEKILRGINS